MLPKTLDIDVLFPKADSSQWRALAEADLNGAPFDKKLMTRLYEGITLQPLYTAEDAVASSGYSGQRPMTRGSAPLGTGPLGWDIRQERAEPDLAAFNAALREDLTGGAGSVVLRLDAAARHGWDAGDPRGTALSARDGLAAYSVDDLDRAFEGVHLEMIGIALEAGAAFLPAAGMLAALWDRRGVATKDARGAFQADPLAVLARDGGLPYPTDAGLGLAAELAEWTSATYPSVAALRVGTAPYHHAGATATQDLAFSMATGIEYLRAMTARGMSVGAASRQLLFSYAVGCNFFLAMAKLRAARRLWARVIEASGGSEDDGRMTMFVRPSKRVFTARDPWVNILRNAVCVLAAGMGGADAIASSPYDAMLGEPTSASRTLARNTHHLLMEECRAHRVCDPSGGSWYVERLTDELCEQAWTILGEIERRGGMARALSEGWVAGAIAKASEPRAKNIATRRDVVVGVSDFPNLGEQPTRAMPTDVDAVAGAARSRLAARASVGVSAGERVARAERARAGAAAGATIGQLAGALFPGGPGAALEKPVQVHPYAEAFERLRNASDRHLAECGVRPRAFLVTLGTVAERQARVNYCQNLLEAGGFEVRSGPAEGSVAGAVAAFAGAEAPIAVICGVDAAYPIVVPELAPKLHAAGARVVVLAGNPGEREAAYRSAGVDRFVFVRCDVLSLLSDLLREAGVLS